MPLNADQLEAFRMVAECGGYHRAAAALHLSQSAITQRIQALEAELGCKLFMRAGRGVTLSPAGQSLVRHARQRREAEAALRAELAGSEAGLAGRLAIASGTAEGRILLPAVAALGHEHPDLDLAVRLDDALEPVPLLESGQVDAVLGDAPLKRRGLRSVRVGALVFGLVAGRLLAQDWPERPDGAMLRRARAVDFHPADRITLDHLARCWPQEDFSDLRRHFVNDTRAILEWVLAGLGFSVLPLSMAVKRLEQGELRLFHPEIRSVRPLYLSSPEGVRPPALGLLEMRLRIAASPTTD